MEEEFKCVNVRMCRCANGRFLLATVSEGANYSHIHTSTHSHIDFNAKALNLFVTTVKEVNSFQFFTQLDFFFVRNVLEGRAIRTEI